MNFTIEELCHTDTKILNIPNSIQRNNLQLLIEEILQPLREGIGAPININSGFRCSKLNNFVKGSSTSQHLYGQAADITTKDMKSAFNFIKEKLPFDQLIWENGSDSQPDWIHVSYSNRNRKQVLRKFKGKSGYHPFSYQ